ncbi:kinesin-like protein KIF24 [Pempheris klunzingeri]|uniref:kinesin-like protein KIF24 n=1 Tax=Pempheris klunzingeri TaxID=3127111 RepID=UPI003980AE3D
MEKLKHVRWSEVKEKRREKEGEEMTLYECLRAVGLQRHYARFTSVGVHHTAHLSALTMEDYPILGIRSMEDRTQLFHLIQTVKTLDLGSLEYENCDVDDYDADGGNEGHARADSIFTCDCCGDPDEDVYDDEDEKDTVVSKPNAVCFSKPSCVRRQLDFSCEAINHHHQKLFPHPVGTVHVYASHNRNNVPGQGKGSAIPVQHVFDTGSAVVCGCKGSINHWPDVHSNHSHRHTGVNSEPDSLEGISMHNSHTRLSPKCVSFHKSKPRQATMASKGLSSKSVWHKDRKGISRKKKLHTEVSSNRASGHMAKPLPVYESKRTAGYNYGLPQSSPSAPNRRQSGRQRISVCVRKRPLTHTECRIGETDVVTTPSGECVIVHESKEAVDLTQYILQHRFYFDQVFGEESSNEEVYQRTAYPLVQHMLNGGKATCFAFGQTGAGKTHTMLGSSPGRPGLYALAVQDIFAHLSTTHTHSPLLVYVSFFEIYCGQLYDLLDHRKRLFAREDGQKVVHIAGLRDIRVDSVSSLLEVISQGTEERTQGMSGVNPLSSRSHALLQIQLRGSNQQTAGRMWFIDLAGSERASDTKEPDRQSRMEGAEINQSLLALKECIRSLDQEQSHTPFRQSKLTQVLKDSFVGDSMTCMIANISPGHLATEHTLNTLRYADRVKELKGQGGLRGGKGKTVPSPKRNLFNSSSSSGGSSIGTRGKSPPKKPKLGRQKEAFGPTTPTTRVTTGGAVLCSTPKNSRWREETSARTGLELGEITPVRGLQGIGDKRQRRERENVREGRRRERYGGTDTIGHSIGDQNERKSGFYHREKENQQRKLKGVREGERRWIEQRRQVESSGGTRSEVERLRERDLQKVNEREKERETHLRQYHQHLQQFMPSSASSSVDLFAPSTFPPFSSSNQTSLSSTFSPPSCSSPQHSSRLSLSALMYHGLEEVLDAYRARVEARADGNRGQLSFIPSGDICLRTKTSPNYNNNKDEVGHGDSGGIVRREDWGTTGMEREGKRRWAWVATTETEQAGRMTGARPADVEAVVSYNCDSVEWVGEEEQEASDVPADEVWSTDDDSLFNHSPVKSPHQRAPAERPLSPACEHTHTLLTPNNKFSNLSLKLKHTKCSSNILPLPLQNCQQAVPSSSLRKKEPWLVANVREFSNAPLATLDNTQARTHPEVKAKMSVLPQQETSTDSVSYIMEPLSISLLQVDQQAATASFLQGAQDNTSLYSLENERREDNQRKVEKDCFTCAETENKVVGAEVFKFHPSLLKLPQPKTHCPPISDTMTATNHSMIKPPVPEVIPEEVPVSQNNKKPQTTPAIDVVGNKAPASPLKPSTCASLQTSVVQPISSSVQHSGNTWSPSSLSLMSNSATQMPPDYAHNVHNKRGFFISSPQSESVLGQLNALPNSPMESNSQRSTSNQQIRPIIHLSTLEDLDHGQWRIVQAHWEQLEEMEALCHDEGTLLCQQPNMEFATYVHKLEEIMERKAQCVHGMIAQLQPFLQLSHSNCPHNQGENDHDPITQRN